MNELTKIVLKAAAKWLATAIATYLVTHFQVSADAAQNISVDIGERIILYAPLAATLAYSVWEKYRNRVKFMTALQLPAGTTERVVDLHIEHGFGASVTPKT